MTDIASLWRDGDLAALRTTLAEKVRSQPAVAAHRLALADVMIVQGDLDAADKQLDIAAGQEPERAVLVALTRQLVRAAVARVECFEQRRPPELVAEADGAIAAALARLAGMPGEEEGPLAGTIDGKPFDGLRDGDDRTAGVLEVLTTTGKYVWVSLAQIVALTVDKPERPRDLVWRKAELEVRGGPTGVVYLPAIYHAGEMTDAQRLGRETDWIDQDREVWGRGLRTFLVGDEAVVLGEFESLAVVG